MIDTIILTIPNADKLIWEPDRFTPTLKGIRENAEKGFGAKLFMKYTQNINSKHGYYPRLTVTPRWNNGLQIPLRIEFSVPKLLYGNNLDELEDKDFPLVIETLKKKLEEMGVRVFTANLESALVSGLHFGKNIVISGHYTATSAIKIISKCEVTKKLDINNRHFQNDGHALYFDCGSYQIVFYDKIRDITKSKRQAVDKDKTAKQLELFNLIKDNKIPLEILRLEVRLTKKVKLNSIFNKLGYPINPTFKQVFSSHLSQLVLKDYWNTIKEKNLFILKISGNNVLKQVINYQKTSGKKFNTIETLGLAQIIEYSKNFGLRSLKNELTSFYSPRTWFRQAKYLNSIEEILSKSSQYPFVDDIENALNDYKPYRVPEAGLESDQIRQ